MKNIFYFFIAGILLISCESSHSNIENVAKNYYKTFAKGNDNKTLSSFYADKVSYTNVTQNVKIDTISNKDLVEQIINWNDKDMIRQKPEFVVLEKIVVNDSTIVASGYFTGYVYKGNPIEPMKFVSWMDLDQNLHIKKQTDWLNYPLQDILDGIEIKKSVKFGE